MWKGILNLPLEEMQLYAEGEYFDLIACYQIANGIAKEKKITKKENGIEYIPDWR